MFKTSFFNISGCIISSAEIRLFSQEKTIGERDDRGYEADSRAPNGTTGTLRACAGSACKASTVILMHNQKTYDLLKCWNDKNKDALQDICQQ